jgi:predicted nuclease with TOPRIM domain
MNEWTKRIKELERENERITEAWELLVKEHEEFRKRMNKLKSAVSAHIKVCRGWLGDDPVWEQIIAHNEWDGKRE